MLLPRPERRVDYRNVMPREDIPEEPKPPTLLDKLIENFHEGRIGDDTTGDLK